MAEQIEEYTDEQTGTRLTVDRDIPGWPRITVFAPDNADDFTIDELNESIRRLMQMANIHPGDKS